MDSDGDGDDQQEFAKQGGDALNLDDADNDAFNDSEDAEYLERQALGMIR